jgi:sensor histidine kinase YesM
MNFHLRNRVIFWPLVGLVTYLFVQGMSGVVYFSLELVKPVNLPEGLALGVVFSNLASALAVLTVVVPLYVWRHQRPAWKWYAQVTFQRISWKIYALIAGLTGVVNLAYGFVVAFAYWIPLYRHSTAKLPAPDSPSIGTFFYYLAPMCAACLLYYWLTRERYQTVRFWEQEAQMLRLNELKTKAELEALQAKINPHFLYNALNSIASLVHLDPDKAEEMTLLLSKFFRYSTAVKSQYHDTVDHELDLVSTYLDVEKVRFDERLTYSIELADEGLREKLIPRFLLQPLVENAIKHGISKRAGEGQIRLTIRQQGDQLVFCLHDNGPPFPESLTAGYGLQSIRDKLRLLGGADATLELVNGPDKHVRVTLTPPGAGSGEQKEEGLRFEGLKV